MMAVQRQRGQSLNGPKFGGVTERGKTDLDFGNKMSETSKSFMKTPLKQ